MILNVQFPAMVFEPLSVGLVFGHDGGYHVPEVFGVVHVGQVTEFMDNYIVQNAWRSVHQAVIEG